MTKEEQEEKRKSRVSKNQEFFRLNTHSGTLAEEPTSRPLSAPLTRPKKLTTPKAKTPKTPKSEPTKPVSKIVKNVTPSPKTSVMKFTSPTKYQIPTSLDLLPLTSRTLQNEISESSSESDKDRSLNNDEFLQEDDFHRFGEWSSNLQPPTNQNSETPLLGSDLDFIKNELCELRTNMNKLDPNSKLVENILEEKRQRETELEEKSNLLEHELEISRQAYFDLENEFALYRHESEERTIELMRQLEQLEYQLKQANDVGRSPKPADDKENIFQINGRTVLRDIADETNFSTPKKNQLPPNPVITFESKLATPKSVPIITRNPMNVQYYDDDKENNLLEFDRVSDDISPYATYRYGDVHDNPIEIHRPLIVGRDFSNTINNGTGIVTKQNKEYSPPSSYAKLVGSPNTTPKVRKFNIREKH